MGSICSRRPSLKADVRPLGLLDQEMRPHDQDFDSAVDAPEPEPERREEARPIWRQILELLPAVAWSLCGWSALVGFPEAVYWHFLDPYSAKVHVPPLVVAGAWALSLLVIDCCGLQRVLSASAGAVAVLPPALFTLSALPSVEVRSASLTSSVGALAWSAAAVLGSAPTDLPRRQRDGWACLISLCGLLMLRWAFATENPLLTEPSAKVAVGCCGVISAVLSVCEERAARRTGASGDAEQKWPVCGDCRGIFDCGNWPAACATGMMGGSALVLFQTYLSSLEAPSQNTFETSSSLQALWALAAFTCGTAALAAVYSMVPWWLDTCQAALFIGGLPLLACSLQWTADEAVDGWGFIQGTGSRAYAGLLALAAAFPFMLALFGKELYLLARSRAAGRALFIAASSWLVSFQAHFAVIHGGAAPSWGTELAGRPYLLALLLGGSWSFGVASAPNGAGRPSVHELWYMSQHSSPKPGLYTKGALVLLCCSLGAFFGAAVPSRAFTLGKPAGSEDNLVAVLYNVQQGFDLHGWPNADCVVDFLGAVGADLVGLPEASAPRLATGNTAIAAAYGRRLGMQAYLGAPGAMASVDGAILSQMPFNNVSTRALKVLTGCDHCPTQTHLWTRATVTWKQVPLEFHSVHTEWFADAADQFEDIARQIRLHYATGPLILVGTLNLPQRENILPLRTALARLLQGTGLKEAFGALARNAILPLQPTEFVSGLHLDYMFYRGLDLVGASIHGEVECSDHMPLVASFRLAGEAA